MFLGKKGLSVSLIVMIIVVVAAVAFVAGTNYQIPAPPSVAKAPLVEVPQETPKQETTTAGETQTTNETTTTTTTSQIPEPEATPTVEVSKKLGDHVVISEIKFAGNEFVELYNPTDADVDLTGWWIAYYPAYSDWNDPKSNVYTPLKIGSKIKSHGFFLIGGKGYSSTADAQLSTTPDQGVLGDYGAVAIFSQDIRGMTAADAKAKKVDAVGWMASDPVAEGKPIELADFSNQQQSLERKPGESEPTGGNHVDTENNANDFAVRSSSEPQSTASAVEP